MTARLWAQQTLVNVVTTGSQDRPSIATLNNGNLIVVWRDSSRGNSDVYGRLFSPTGQPLSGELSIGFGSPIQSNPSVTALDDGGFLVSYQEGTYLIMGRFSEAGVNIADAGLQPNLTNPVAAGTGNGAGFAVAFKAGASDLQVARYDSAGAFINSQPVNTVASTTLNPDMALLTDGRMVIVWVTSTSSEVLYRLVSAAGTVEAAIGSAGTLAEVPAEAKVTALQNGAFLITWHGAFAGYPASGIDVIGRIIDSSGLPVGNAFLINSRTFGTQSYGDVVGLPNGAFIAVWSDGGAVLRAQVFDAFGQRVGADTAVNMVGSVFSASGIEATLLADGRVAVVWNGSSGPGDTDGVFMQIIDPRDGYVEGGAAADTLYGHDVLEDVMVGRASSDKLYGLGGNDALYGGDAADIADGGNGDDVISGGTGGDTLTGGNGDDLIYGELGDDIVGGGAGHDLIFGGLNNDWLEGGADNDTILGEGGGDRLEGQDGNDVLDGGIGDDVMIGGAGNDIIYVDSLGDQVIEAAGGGTDVVYSSVNWFGNANVENVVLTGNVALNATMNGDANLVAGNGAANVINGAGGNDTIDGIGGNDWLGGGDGADRLDGGADNDTIQGGVGADALYGGSGADSFYYGSYLDSNATQGIDSVQDFQVGVDKINLTPARLSLTDSATIVYAYGNAYVFVDLYGDGINDMIIEVIGATTLSGADLNFAPPAAAATYYGGEEVALTEAQQAAHHRATWDAAF